MKKQDLDTLMKLQDWIESGIYKFYVNEWSDPTADMAILLYEIREYFNALDETKS